MTLIHNNDNNNINYLLTYVNAINVNDKHLHNYNAALR